MRKEDEQLMLNCRKSFADRLDFKKSVKLIEQSISELTETLNKRNNKQDNWLIAKKPINGYNCASCESYIGEIKNTGESVNWNKYPYRDGDKIYRVVT